jgi:hypothetical protein
MSAGVDRDRRVFATCVRTGRAEANDDRKSACQHDERDEHEHFYERDAVLPFGLHVVVRTLCAGTVGVGFASTAA